jgi:dihydropteroate synthase-like protein
LGAEIIDVGMIAGESRPLDAKRAVKTVKNAVNVPVSIDTFDLDEAREAVSAGADMILSVDAGNVEDVAVFASKVAVVVIPTNHRRGYFPKRAKERVSLLEENIRKAKELGMMKVFGDLILDPVNTPGMVESLIAYHEFARRNPDVPLLFGVGNVAELMDADSVGIHALLAGIASEIGANILLTTEKSDKVKGSIKELVTASRMMFLSKIRGTVPKDLGLDLLMLKDKRKREESYNEEVEAGTQTITAGRPKATAVDPKGCFKIMINRENETLIALHFSINRRDKPDVIVKGKSAEEVYAKIIELGLVTKLDHAAYLGSELEKAEIALRTGKDYIQDSPLFKSPYGE